MNELLEPLGYSEEDLQALAEMIADKVLDDEGARSTPEFEELWMKEGSDVLSDFMCKDIKQRISDGNYEFSPEDIPYLAQLAGPDSSGNKYDDLEEGMLGEYAEHLRNYVYNYKPEAVEVDPSIDPDEIHRGPMAQDIEKVAPDCVKETPEGVKTVDGNRLALVNAGVIGELARRLIELEAKVNG